MVRRKREDKANGKGSGSGSINRAIETRQFRAEEGCTVLQLQ